MLCKPVNGAAWRLEHLYHDTGSPSGLMEARPAQQLLKLSAAWNCLLSQSCLLMRNVSKQATPDPGYHA